MRPKIQALDQHPVFRQAMALHQTGKLAEALALYRKLRRPFPDNPQLLSLMGVICLQMGNAADSIQFNRQSLNIEPAQPLARFYLGVAFKRQNRLDDALASYQQAIALKPDYAEAYCNLGNVLVELKRFEAALSHFDQAIALDPHFALAHFNRGNLLRELKLFEDAAAAYRLTLACKPDLADAWCNLGVAYKELKRYAEAVASYERAFAVKPDFDFLAGQRLFTRLLCCDWANLQQEIADITAKIANGRKMALPFQVLSLTGDPAVQQKAAICWTQEKFPAGRDTPKTAGHAGRQRIRLGYFSADFRIHPVAFLTARLFELHDRAKFELYGFSFGSVKDDMTDRLKAGFEHFIDIADMTDQQAAELVQSLEIDIAVDLGGHTQDSRTGLFAMRIAPLQVNFLGYPGTLGAGYMDYLLADRVVIPENRQAFYTESIAYLPNAYLVNDDTQPIADQVIRRQDFGLPDAGFVFCCFNNAYKINPDIFDCWMRILDRVTGSVLWLSVDHPPAQENLRREAASRGIDANRLIFARRMPDLAEHLARLQLADLFLDTLPYNAHTTASDALWAGLPLLTRAGEGFAGRVAASLLTAIGLPELITHSQADYEALAVELASQPDKLAAIRSRLAENRRTAALFDTARFARDLEAAYAAMQARRLAGLPPAVVTVQASTRISSAGKPAA
ncbi:MAG: tetratricopeptide repeat protein [Methylococcales bacterium]|nr:tetratricopeptide repeat protein [Methylococcales bacterium]